MVRISQNSVCRHKLYPGDGNMTKIQNLANSKWRMDTALKSLFGYNSAAYCPIKMKFGVRRQNHRHTKQVRLSKCLITKTQNSGRQHFRLQAGCPSCLPVCQSTGGKRSHLADLLAQARLGLGSSNFVSDPQYLLVTLVTQPNLLYVNNDH